MYQNTTDSSDNSPTARHLVFIAIFFLITPLVIFSCLFSLISLKNTDNAPSVNTYEPNIYQVKKSGVRVYASLPNSFPTITGFAEASDGRVELIKKYLTYYHSPLVNYAFDLVSYSDLYSLDWKLLTAIAQQESNLCKMSPPGTYNCWGWGIHSKGTLGFSSYQEGIKEVAKGLREEYVNKGYVEIEDIMSKYTPLSNGSWAQGVRKFMSEIENGTYL